MRYMLYATRYMLYACRRHLALQPPHVPSSAHEDIAAIAKDEVRCVNPYRKRLSLFQLFASVFVPRMSCQMIIGIKTVLSDEKTLQMKCRFLAGCGTSGTISRFMTQVSVVQLFVSLAPPEKPIIC